MARSTQRFDPRQTMQGNTFEIFHYQDMPSRHPEAHYHDFYELFFFIDGDVDYWVEGDVYHLRAGDILLLPPAHLHKPIPRGGAATYERIVLWVDRGYLGGIAGGALESCFTPSHAGANLLRLSTSERKMVHDLALSLNEEFHGNGYAKECCEYGLLLQLLTAINRLFRQPKDSSSTAYRTPTFISEILTYIGNHYHENLTLDGLAAHFFINKYYLSHEFKKAVGVGVHRYVTLRRLHAAYDLLSEGKPAGQVGLQCGFSDYTAFFRAFKAEYGISPTACPQSNT